MLSTIKFRIFYFSVYFKTQKIIILLVMCRFETWSLNLREVNKLRLFENRVWRVRGPKREEVAGGWWKSYNKEVHNVNSPVLNQAPLHEDVLGEWRYSSTHS
jgi:hypothetical protein